MKKKILEDMIFAIAKIEHNAGLKGQPWITADLIDQRELYDLQEKFLELLAEANRLRAFAEFPTQFSLEVK